MFARWKLLLLFIWMSLPGFGQDLHFTQFYTVPLYLNPANTGVFKGDYRIVANYRNQWQAIEPLTTIAASFDKAFYFRNRKINAGIFIVNDQSSPIRFVVRKVLLSASIAKQHCLHTFSAGIQGGLVSMGFDESRMTLPEQFNWGIGYFDAALPMSETFYREPILYPDISSGLLWKYDGTFLKPTFGMSFFHLNMPRQNIFGTRDRLNIRKIIYFSNVFDFNDRYFVEPQFLYMEQSKATDLLIGCKAGMKFASAKLESLYAGASMRDGIRRNTDAAMATLGLKLKNWEVVFNYDFNISELKPLTNGNGAMEVAVIYIARLTRLTQIQIPCEQF